MPVATATQPARRGEPANIATQVTLPGGFQSLASAPVAAKPSESVHDAYIWFASSKSAQWSDMLKKCPGLVDGDTVFVSPDHTEIIRVMRYHLIAATQYWARKDPATGQPMSGVVFEQPGDRSKDEYIDAVLMVQTAKGLLPARARFKSGLVGALSPAIAELATVTGDPGGWASRSAAHEVASKVQVPAPGFRFVVEASFGKRTSKSSGFQYMQGRATCRPITADDAKLFAGLADPGVQALCSLVAAEQLKRLEAIRKLPA